MIQTQKGMAELKQFRQDLATLLKIMLKPWHYPNPNSCGFCAYAEMCIKRQQDLSADLVNEARRLIDETEAASKKGVYFDPDN